MTVSRKHLGIAAGVLASVLVGGSTLFAASNPSAAPQGFWNAVAGRLGIPASQLTQAIQNTQLANLQTTAAKHHWSQTQIQQASTRIAQEHLGPPRILHPLPALKLIAVLRLAAVQLHLTPAQLVAALNTDHTLSAVASAHQLNPATLQQALLTQLTARLQTAVNQGHMTVQRKTAITNHWQVLLGKWMNRDLTEVHWQKPLVTTVLKRSAAYLGLSLAALRQALGQGQTLAQISSAHNHTVQELVAAIVAPNQTHLQKLVSDNQLTAAQAQTRLSSFQTQVTRLVNRVFHIASAT